MTITKAMASEAKALFTLCPPRSDCSKLGQSGQGVVQVFPPGHVLVDGKLIPYHVRSFHSLKSSSVGDCEELSTFRELLERAVEKRVRHGDRPVGLLCSGGVDSAVLTTIAASLPDVGQLRVFTMQYSRGRSDDAVYVGMGKTRYFSCTSKAS